VIYNDGAQFSAGANIGMALFAANLALWPLIDEFIAYGQQVYKALKYSPFPVVGAPSGLAVGGGCEVLLSCDAIQAHIESYIGLVEVGVGLVPAWGGCKEILTRWTNFKKRPQGPMPAVSKVFEMIATAQVAKSADEAKEMLILRENDGITMNRDRLLQDAKNKVLALAENYTPPLPQEIKLPGETAKAAFELVMNDYEKRGLATPYDKIVVDELTTILSGNSTDMNDLVSEDKILKLEYEGISRLIRKEGTLARIEHMLETGKPLRN
jgi:3-hydroxyacyl-CoA dehydrogenase